MRPLALQVLTQAQGSALGSLQTLSLCGAGPVLWISGKRHLPHAGVVRGQHCSPASSCEP